MKPPAPTPEEAALTKAVADFIYAMKAVIDVSVAEAVAKSMPKQEKPVERPAASTAPKFVPPLITLNDTCKMTSMSRTMLNRYRAEGRFPVAVELGDRRIAFVRAEVEAWIDAKIKGRK